MTIDTVKESDGLQSFLSGKLSQVDVGKIEAELSAMWSMAADVDRNAPDGQANVIRSCSLNLILVTDNDQAEIKEADLLGEVVADNPCRAILAISRPDKSSHLDAWVSARCHFASGSRTKRICSEQINVVFDGEQEHAIPSVLESLVVRDLPTYLWWTLTELSGERIAPFIGSAQRLIVDSLGAPNAVGFLQTCHEIIESMDGHLVVSDLNWQRILPFRVALACGIEREPLQISDLADINRLEIEVADHDGKRNLAQALYLLGWLAVCLGWQVKECLKTDKDGWQCLFRNGTRMIPVRIYEVTDSQNVPIAPDGWITAVKLCLAGENNQIRASRNKSGLIDGLDMVIKKGNNQHTYFAPHDFHSSVPVMVGQELASLGPDPIFLESIAAAATINEEM